MELKLTSKERLVLYGLARYPGLSDIDLAMKIGVDRSTIFKSKRKFRDWQLIKLLNVPSGEAVGAEILTGVAIRYRPEATIEVRRGSEAFDEWMSHPNCVYHTYTETDSVSIIYSKNFTEFKKNFDPFINEYNRKDFIQNIECIHFPLELTWNSSDACLGVNDIYDLKRDDLPEGLLPMGPRPDGAKLTEKDKLTLYAFVKYPMLSDLELSRRTGISRPTISGKRTKFFQSGLLSREAHVEWQKICCQLITFYNLKIDRGTSEEEIFKVYATFSKMGSPLFSYFQPGCALGAFLSPTYQDLKRRLDTGLRSLAEQGLLEDEPTMVIMPIRDIGATKADYSPMVARMLDISKEI